MRILLVWVYCFTIAVVSAEELGDAATTRVLLPLYTKPSEASQVLGRLPAGTVVRFKGERASGLSLVEVELEGGWVSGWIRDEELDFGSKAPIENSGVVPGQPTIPERANRRVIPQDERLLLARESTFFYGAFVGPNFGMVKLPDEDFFQGIGITVGGRVGIFTNRLTSVGLLVDYSLLGGNGSGNSQPDPLQFGYCDTLLEVSYRTAPFEISAQFGAAFGISVPDNLPQSVKIDSPISLSSPLLGVRALYRIEGSQFLRIGFGLNYRIHLLANPPFVHAFLGELSVTFEG